MRSFRISCVVLLVDREACRLPARSAIEGETCVLAARVRTVYVGATREVERQCLLGFSTSPGKSPLWKPRLFPKLQVIQIQPKSCINILGRGDIPCAGTRAAWREHQSDGSPVDNTLRMVHIRKDRFCTSSGCKCLHASLQSFPVEGEGAVPLSSRCGPMLPIATANRLQCRVPN